MWLSAQEIHRLCIAVGWRGDDAIDATIVAIGASGGDPDAHFPPNAAENVTYRGLFGLRVRRDDEEDRMKLFDYRYNARQAFARWVGNGRSWKGHPLYPLDDFAEVKARLRATLVAEATT